MPEYVFNRQECRLHYPAVMGILNLTPDSFSDGGAFLDPSLAIERALAMVEEGAQVIDVGGESTRPGSKGVSEQDELSRVLPVLEKLPRGGFMISIDTTKPAVARAAELGWGGGDDFREVRGPDQHVVIGAGAGGNGVVVG